MLPIPKRYPIKKKDLDFYLALARAYVAAGKPGAEEQLRRIQILVNMMGH